MNHVSRLAVKKQKLVSQLGETYGGSLNAGDKLENKFQLTVEATTGLLPMMILPHLLLAFLPLQTQLWQDL